MRFGTNKKNIDNASSGGFFVPINLASGTLEEKGMQLLKHGGKTYMEHPDTGFKFKGFKIPYFKDVVNETINVSSNFTNKMIGWDIAIGENEIIFIEGNSNGSLLMSQIACGGFNNHPVYSKILQNLL